MSKIVKITLILVALIIISIIAWQAINFFQTGEVIISTSDGAEITLLASDNIPSSKVIGKTKASIRLKPGFYTFQTDKNNESARKTVTVNSNQTSTHEILLRAIKDSELVFKANARDVYATNTTLTYVDIGSNSLYVNKIGDIRRAQPYSTQGKLSNVYSMDWIRNNYGVANTIGGAIALVDGSNVTFYPLPIEARPPESTDYGDISRSNFVINNNLEVVTQVGSKIFYQKNLNSQVSEIYSSDKPKVEFVIDISNTGVVAIGESTPTVYGEGSEESKITLYDTRNMKVKKQFQETNNTNQVLWNNSNKLLISNSKYTKVIDEEGNYEVVLFNGSVKKPSATKWISNEEVVYFDENTLWSININSLYSYKFGDVDNANYINDTSISEDGKYLYYTVGFYLSRGVIGGIYRLPIK